MPVATRKTESEAILDQLGRLLRELTRQAGGADDGPSMTASQRITLVELALEGPLRLNDLAQRVGVSLPTASRSVDALEALGLAERAQDPTDRRALSIDLTPGGRALFDERAAKASRAFEPAAATLSADERRTLLALLERMAAAMRSG
jgi:DNA-binding MarR family transcriptional regulator